MRGVAGILLLMGTIGFLPGQRRGAAPAAAVPSYGYQVVRSYPHDGAAFTQGLLVRNGVFYESTGLNGKSGIRKVKIETGEVRRPPPIGTLLAKGSLTGRPRSSRSPESEWVRLRPQHLPTDKT